MKRLALFVLALVLLIPSPASARPIGYMVLNTTCEEDADQLGDYVIQATTDMWTNKKDDPDTVEGEKVTRLIVVYEEYRDYGDGRWILSRQTKDIARRSIGQFVDGYFHHSVSYDVSFDPTIYDVRVDFIATFKGLHASNKTYATIAKKRDGGQCFAKSFGEPPPGL